MIRWPYDEGSDWSRHGNPLFGLEGWEHTHRGDHPTAFYVATPIGEECVLCDEEILAGDAGELMLAVDQGERVMRVFVLHRECMMLRHSGHEFGLCPCTAFEGLSQREAALECARRAGG